MLYHSKKYRDEYTKQKKKHPDGILRKKFDLEKRIKKKEKKRSSKNVAQHS
jgi:hypothetical protein